jgi:hypothetical protein
MSKKDDVGEGLEIIKSLSIGDCKIDGSKSENISKKVLDERETRKRLLIHARMLGFEKDMLLLFAKYDKLLRNCTNEQERLDIGKMGAYEAYKLLGGHGELYVNGTLVVKDN